ncbi:MAG: Gx transporter family protein [Oscillospiraceae bacterium]
MAKKIAYYGSILSIALIFSFVESLIPFPFLVPGIKLGLANIIAVFLLYKSGTRAAFFVNTARILLAGILFGNAFSIIYSLSGGILSVAAMSFFRRFKALGPVGVSVIGSTAHSIGQIFAAALVLWTPAVIFYLPVLILIGVFSGILIGIAAYLILKRLDAAHL